MPLTQLEAELRPIARERIAKGRLPHDPPKRMWGGRGTGQLCAVCDKPIQPDEVELEVEQSLGATVHTFYFHALCQSVWQLECARNDYLKKHP